MTLVDALGHLEWMACHFWRCWLLAVRWWIGIRRLQAQVVIDCKSVYDHVVCVGSPIGVTYKRNALDRIVESLPRLAATLTERQWADAPTKDQAEPTDLFRAVMATRQYQIADEPLVLARAAEDRARRKERGQEARGPLRRRQVLGCQDNSSEMTGFTVGRKLTEMQVRSLFESMADGDPQAQVEHTRGQCRLGITAKFLWTQMTPKEGERMVRLIWTKNTGYLQVQAATAIVDIMGDQAKAMVEAYAAVLLKAGRVMNVEGTRLTEYFRVPEYCKDKFTVGLQKGASWAIKKEHEEVFDAGVRRKPMVPIPDDSAYLASLSIVADNVWENLANWPEVREHMLEFMRWEMGLPQIITEEEAALGTGDNMSLASFALVEQTEGPMAASASTVKAGTKEVGKSSTGVSGMGKPSARK